MRILPLTRSRLETSRVHAAIFAACLAIACAGNPDGQTLAELRDREPDLTEVPIDDGIEQAMAGYREFLEQAPKSALTPEAMRRLADLKLEKEYGVLGATASPPAEQASLPTPSRPEQASAEAAQTSARTAFARDALGPSESQLAFEERATAPTAISGDGAAGSLTLPDGAAADTAGPLEAIALYDQILEAYPDYAQNDQVLYQKARAYDELGRVDEAIEVAALLVEKFPESRHLDEIQFRRAEYFFTRKKYFDAEEAYAAIIAIGGSSDYYELALYKMGWTLYKQMMLEEALQSYVTLLDHKVSTGYDFDQTEDEAAQQRVSDTYRVMSLCFSELGGAEAITSFFALTGPRSYEDRVYRHLGEFYLEKLRYNDAASVYEAFVDLYPIHQTSPHFSMRVVEIYEAGNFPKLVLASKKKFAASYGLESNYWQHFDPDAAPEVLDYLKDNLEDLATHYHALYQNPERPEDRVTHFEEATLWYRAFLSSFPAEPETPGIHYRLADLLLENEDWNDAASEYETIAYDYPAHERASSAGYAAIFAYREHEKVLEEAQREPVRRKAIESTLRFVDRFPTHEHAAAVLGAAIDDLYGLEEHALAISTGHRLIEQFPESLPSIRRAAWAVIAHASFDTEAFASAEDAYARVLELMPEEDESRTKILNNLAASIYKQGEHANAQLDYRSAADHFLRIAAVAPASEIRPIAEYDAGAALIRLEDWSSAASILEAFRSTFPDHELTREATRQVAFVYREDGNLARAAEEYERVADEASEPELRREARLEAAELYENAEKPAQALAAYRLYVDQFPEPLEPAVAARFKMAALHEQMGDEAARREELGQIVSLDRSAGASRTDGVRLYAARSALILSEDDYTRFAEIELTLPFERSLERKKERMSKALATFGGLIDYEVGEVTAAATFYMAEVYAEFSRALLESERPADLEPMELDDYEMVLEEEAFPFEEKSIEVHEKNLELMTAGVFNNWIEKSLARLAVVMPGRYAKFDASTGLIQSIKTYTYRTPRSLLAVQLAEAPTDTPGAIETPAEDAPETVEVELGSAGSETHTGEPAEVEETDDSRSPDPDLADPAPVPAAPAPASLDEGPVPPSFSTDSDEPHAVDPVDTADED